MAATSSNIRERKNLKYIYIASIFGFFILWITIYTPSLNLPNSLRGGDEIRTDDEYNTDNDLTLNKSSIKIEHNKEELCTPKTFNQGKWIYDPLELESPHNATQFAQVAGYHCIKKFAHRCFRRPGDEILRAKQMYVIIISLQ